MQGTQGIQGLSGTAEATTPSTITRTTFTATPGQTTFSVVYTPNYIQVYLNGSHLDTTEYTATNGTTVVLSSGASLNDIIEVVAYDLGNYVPGPQGIQGIQGLTGPTNVTITDDTSTNASNYILFNNASTGSLGNVNVSSTKLTFNPSTGNVGIGTVGGGSLTVSGPTNLEEVIETLNTKTSATGTVVHDFTTGAIWYHSSISANFTVNLTNVPTTNDKVVTITLILSQGVTGYYPNALQIDGVSQTIKWTNNSLPTPSVSRIDVASFSLIRTGSAWVVLGQFSNYA